MLGSLHKGSDGPSSSSQQMKKGLSGESSVNPQGQTGSRLRIMLKIAMNMVYVCLCAFALEACTGSRARKGRYKSYGEPTMLEAKVK